VLRGLTRACSRRAGWAPTAARAAPSVSARKRGVGLCGRGHDGPQLVVRPTSEYLRAQSWAMQRLVSLASLMAGASSCSTDPLVCTDELLAVTAAVVNRTGQASPSLNVRDTVLRTGTILDVSAEHPSSGLPIEGTAAVIIFSDAFKTAIRPSGEPVAVGLTAGDHSASARYEFGTDGCHVQKLGRPRHPGG
jgi:hypothetical protein